MRTVALIAALLACAPTVDFDKEADAFEDAYAFVYTGMPEDSLAVMFPRLELGRSPSGRIGVLDVQRYEERGYVSHTWWIGYWMGLDRHLIASIECVNGRVANKMTH